MRQSGWIAVGGSATGIAMLTGLGLLVWWVFDGPAMAQNAVWQRAALVFVLAVVVAAVAAWRSDA